MTLDARIAALPKMPPAIPAEAAGYASAMSARLALVRGQLQAMVNECSPCDGQGWVWRHELPDPTWDGTADDTKYSCPRCADARKVLEATQ